MEYSTIVKFSAKFIYRAQQENEAIVVKQKTHCRSITFLSDSSSNLDELESAIQSFVEDLFILNPKFLTRDDNLKIKPIIFFRNLDRLEKLLSDNQFEDIHEDIELPLESQRKRKKGKERLRENKKLRTVGSIAEKIKRIKLRIIGDFSQKYLPLQGYLDLSPSDFTIKCGDSRFSVHMQIIARCSYFHFFYRNNEKECDLTEDANPEIVKLLIQYLYDQQMEIDEDKRLALYQYFLLHHLADKMNLESLVIYCARKIFYLTHSFHDNFICNASIHELKDYGHSKMPKLPHNLEIHSETIHFEGEDIQVNPLVLEAKSFFLLKILRNQDLRKHFFPNVSKLFFKNWCDCLHQSKNPSKSKKMQNLLTQENAYELHGLLRVEGLFSFLWEKLEVWVYKGICQSKDLVQEPFIPFKPFFNLSLEEYSTDDCIKVLETLSHKKSPLSIDSVRPTEKGLSMLLLKLFFYKKKFLNVKGLDLSQMKLSAEELSVFFQIFPGITSLSLSGINLNGIETLKNMPPYIKELDLSSCYGVQEIFLNNLIEKCSWIESVNLSWCSNVTDDAIIKMAEKYQLSELEIRGCHQVTDKSLVCLIEQGAHLSLLDVRDCPNITDASILELDKKCRYYTIKILVSGSGVVGDYSKHPTLSSFIVSIGAEPEEVSQ